MKIYILTSLLFFLCIATIKAQNYFQINMPNSGSVSSVSVLSNGDFIAVSNESQTNSVVCSKFNKNGAIIWNKNIKELVPVSVYMTPRKIISTMDGGFAVVCYRATSQSFCVIKLDFAGNIEWFKSFGSSVPKSIIQLSDNGFIIVGDIPGTYETTWIVRCDANGNYLWNKRITYFYPGTIINTNDGGFAIFGHLHIFTTPAAHSDFVFLKFDVNGVLQWSKAIGGNKNERGCSVIQTFDYGYILVGLSNSFNSTTDQYIVKLSSNGEIEWKKTFSGPGYDNATSVIQLNNADYVVLGYSDSFRNVNDIIISKTTSNGNLIFCLALGDEISTSTYFSHSIANTPDNGFIVTGSSDVFNSTYDGFIAKFDSNFNTCGNYRLVDLAVTDVGNSYVPNIQIDSSVANVNSIQFTTTSPSAPNYICFSVGITQNSLEQPSNFKLFQNYPNPFNPSTTIKFDIQKESNVLLKIYNLSGEEIKVLVNSYLVPGSYSLNWNTENLPSGVYIYRLETKYYTEAKRMVLLK